MFLNFNGPKRTFQQSTFDTRINSNIPTPIILLRHSKHNTSNLLTSILYANFNTPTSALAQSSTVILLSFFFRVAGSTLYLRVRSCAWSSSLSGKQNFTAQSAIRSKWNLDFPGLVLSRTTVSLLPPLYQIRQDLSSCCRDQLCVAHSFYPLTPPKLIKLWLFIEPLSSGEHGLWLETASPSINRLVGDPCQGTQLLLFIGPAYPKSYPSRYLPLS
jgi:hypothetical protein